MSTEWAAFRDKFQLGRLTIAENEHWVWSLRPVQCTLGASVLSLRRAALRMAELTDAEGAGLVNMSRALEGRLSRLFQFEKINYLMLMMVDAHVHFHVVPRYVRAVDRFGVVWKDPGWPGFPHLSEGPGVDPEVHAAVLSAMRGSLSSSASKAG